MVNTNRLVRNYEGTTGVKTGSTSEAGYCLSASALRGDMQLIAVVLGAEDSTNRFNDARKLLDYGFASYDSILIDRKDKAVAQIPIEKGDLDYIDLTLSRDSYVLVPKNQKYEMNKELIALDSFLAPIEKGDTLGQLIVYINDKEVDNIDLISDIDVYESNYLKLLKKTIKTFISNN